MNSGSRAGRILIGVVGVATGLIPLLVDTNPTHLFNSLWAPHARYHGALQIWAWLVSGSLALWLVRTAHGADAALRMQLAALLPAASWAGLFVALAVPGTSPWPDGYPQPAPLPGNVYMAGVMMTLCGLGYWLDRRARAQQAAPALETV
jgi:hypothetical protein